jgi:soluble lytic murein transglycosylase-like protein
MRIRNLALLGLSVFISNSSCTVNEPKPDPVSRDELQAKLAELEKAVQMKDAILQGIKDREEQDLSLGQYAINMMYESGGHKKISDARKQILARSIVRVANDIFEPADTSKDAFKKAVDNKKAFIAVLAIESQFQKFAQSPTGPKGYAQVAKAAFYEAMSDCGVDKQHLHEEDVWETDVNLYAGACYFKKMLDARNGDPYAAIVAYNQGPNSDSVKTFSKDGRMTEMEPLKYVARFAFLKNKVTDKQAGSVPSIQELPKPSPNTK